MTDAVLQDIVSLVIQGVGGGIAASAVDLAGSNNVRDILASFKTFRSSLIYYLIIGYPHYAGRDCFSTGSVVPIYTSTYRGLNPQS